MPDQLTSSSHDHLRLLMAQIGRGDESAFAQFYDLVSDRVHGLLWRLIRDPALAEDVSQEVFLEIWRNASRYDPDKGTPITWVLTIAHRRGVDRVRSEVSNRNRNNRAAAGDQQVEWDSTSEAAVDSVVSGESSRLVAEAMLRLTDNQRNAVQLAYFDGLTHAQVAEHLGMPLGTAKSRIREGMMSLRAIFGVSPEPQARGRAMAAAIA